MRKDNIHRRDRFLRHLGDAIRYRRVALLLSQEQLGLKAGFHRSYVTDVENGLRNISLLTAIRFSKALESLLSTQIVAAEQAMARDNDQN